MKYFIGLDAHSATSTFAVVDQDGQCVLRKQVDTTEKNIHWVIEQVNGIRELTLEESTLSQWLYLTIKDKVDRLVICNPTYMAKRIGAKTDFRDALHLAQELRTNHLQEVHHESSHWIELRTLVSGHQDITQEIVRFKNRLKSIFRASAINTDENCFYKNKERVIELKNISEKFVAEKLKYKDQFKNNKTKYRPIRNLYKVV